MARFSLGQKVKRRKIFQDKTSEYMYGTVTLITSDGIEYPELYNIRWDDSSESFSVLPSSLEPI